MMTLFSLLFFCLISSFYTTLTPCHVAAFVPPNATATSVPSPLLATKYLNGTILRAVYDAATADINRQLSSLTNLTLSLEYFTIGNSTHAETASGAESALTAMKGTHYVGLLAPTIVPTVASHVCDDGTISLSRLGLHSLTTDCDSSYRLVSSNLDLSHSVVDTLFGAGTRCVGVVTALSHDRSETNLQRSLSTVVLGRVLQNKMTSIGSWELHWDHSDSAILWKNAINSIKTQMEECLQDRVILGLSNMTIQGSLIFVLPTDSSVGINQFSSFVNFVPEGSIYSFKSILSEGINPLNRTLWSVIGGQIGLDVTSTREDLNGLFVPIMAPYLFEKLQSFTESVPEMLPGGLEQFHALVRDPIIAQLLLLSYDSIQVLGSAVANAWLKSKKAGICPSVGEMSAAMQHGLDIMGSTGRVVYRNITRGERDELDINVLQSYVNDSLSINEFRVVSRWSKERFFEWSRTIDGIFSVNHHKISTESLPLDIPNQLSKFVWVPDLGLAPKLGWGYCANVWVNGDGDEFVIVYGGKDPTNFFDRMYQLDLKRNRWVEIFAASLEGQRPPSSFHSCVIHNDYVFVFGGQDSNLLPMNSLWAFNLNSFEWFSLTSPFAVNPEPRWGAGMVVWEKEGGESSLLVWGGRGTKGMVDSSLLWEYSMRSSSAWTWSSKKFDSHSVPKPRVHFSMSILPPIEKNVNSKPSLLVWGGRISALNRALVAPLSTLQTNSMYRLILDDDLASVTKWDEVTQNGDVPVARFGHGSALVAGSFNFEVAFGLTFDVSSPETMNPAVGEVLKNWCSCDVRDLTISTLPTPTVDWSCPDPDPAIRPRYFFPLVGWDVSSIIYSGKVIDDGNANTPDEKYVKDLWSCQSSASSMPSKCLMIHDHYYSPLHGFARTSSFVAGKYIYIYGGLQDVGSEQVSSSDLQQFDTELFRWKSISPAVVPPPRYDHCGVALGDRYYVFGGVESPLKFRSDVWTFFPSLEKWVEVDTGGVKMKATFAHACSPRHSTQFISMGGYTTANQNTATKSFFMFDYEGKSWKKVKVAGSAVSGTVAPSALLYCNAFVDLDLLWMEGCMNEDSIPFTHLWGINITSGVWERAIPVPPEFQSTRHSLVKIGDGRYGFIGGQVDEALITSMSVQFDLNTGLYGLLRHDRSHNSPRPRSSPTCQFVKNRVICIGGIMGSGVKLREFGDYGFSTPLPSNVVADSWIYHFDQLCSIEDTSDGCSLCSPGSHAVDNICVLCPLNQYSNFTSAEGSDRACYPCRTDLHGYLEGASSDNFCYPTEQFFYNKNVSSEGPTLTQPPKFQKETMYATVTNIATFAVGGVVWVVFVVISLLLWNRGCVKVKWILALNFLFANQHGVIQDERGSYFPAQMVTKKTFFGTYCGLLAIIAVLCMILSNSIIYSTGWNDDEVISLAPDLVPSENPDFFINGKIKLYGGADNMEAGDCIGPDNDGKRYGSCSSKVVCSSSNILCHDDSGVGFAADKFCKCKLARDKELGQKYCGMKFTSRSCNLEKWKLSNVTVTSSGPRSYAKKFSYSLSMSTGYENDPGAYSNISGWVIAPPNTVFRGLSAASSLQAIMIPTNYTRLQAFHNIKGRGYHLDYLSKEFGTVVEKRTFYDQNGFQFIFNIETADNSLVILRSSASSIFTFIPQVLASSVGLLGLFGVAMRVVEVVLGLFGVPDDLPSYEDFLEKRRLKKLEKGQAQMESAGLLDPMLGDGADSEGYGGVEEGGEEEEEEDRRRAILVEGGGEGGMFGGPESINSDEESFVLRE